jgi:hypothetical protein
MNLTCHNQRLPCTGVLDATPHGTFGCGQTDRALLRTRHSLLCWERGWRSHRPGQIDLRLTALGSHSEAYRKGGLNSSLPQALLVSQIMYTSTPITPDFGDKPGVDQFVNQPSGNLLPHTTLCRVSIRTLNDPPWARYMLRSDFKPRSVTIVKDLGCWVLPSSYRSWMDQPTMRSHPNKAVDVRSCQLTDL